VYIVREWGTHPSFRIDRSPWPHFTENRPRRDLIGIQRPFACQAYPRCV
jgi:hypothetical protein